jgi:hypothetical protein
MCLSKGMLSGGSAEGFQALLIGGSSVLLCVSRVLSCDAGMVLKCFHARIQ